MRKRESLAYFRARPERQLYSLESRNTHVQFRGQHFLLDIEGTTSSISFVHDRMFPLVRQRLREFLRENWRDGAVQQACELIAYDAGFSSWHAWVGAANPVDAQEMLSREVEAQMDVDRKATGLKQLQGLIWRAAFEEGELKAHLFPDVLPALQAWRAAGRTIRIYSSGSIAAQRLFFGHTEGGDLLPLFSGHFDTTSGGKKERESYLRIVEQIGSDASEILFASDLVDELDAARNAGLQTVLCQRPGNAAPRPDHGHAQITSFSQIELV